MAPTEVGAIQEIPAATYSPRGGPPSTIGAGGLDCCVRNGNRYISTAITTGNCAPDLSRDQNRRTRLPERPRTSTNIKLQALGRLVPVSLRRYRPYTSGLSTWSSGHGPYLVNPVRDLILKRASHLDAFSAYPTRRSQNSHALGRTTVTPELRLSRLSRARGNLSQISYGCIG